jgi:uncharacterized protein
LPSYYHMISTRKLFVRTSLILAVSYLLVCFLLYIFQERLIFFPEKLTKDFRFSFSQKFEEISIETGEDKLLHGLLFTSPHPKGLIFYLHGNAGALNSWGDAAKRYTTFGYDVFLLDYRGFGKSEGSIKSQMQMFDDVQLAYDAMKKKYVEGNITVLGYSIGTGLAAYLASVNSPKQLILQAPYYNLPDLMSHSYPLIPTFLLKYKFRTNDFIKKCRMPVIIFHGDKDEVIYYGSSLKLKTEMKPGDTLITLKGQGHNGITDNPQYVGALYKILN